MAAAVTVTAAVARMARMKADAGRIGGLAATHDATLG
jgi:hypothetical protein